MEYQRDEHRVHLILYHLVWTPKRRKAVLKDAIAIDCRRLIEQLTLRTTVQVGLATPVMPTGR